MPILDLFSKRQKRARGEVPDAYQYDDLPKQLRAQIAFVLRDILGNADSASYRTEEAFRAIYDALCREYGQFSLLPSPRRTGSHRELVIDFVIASPDVDRVLDVVEVSFALAGELHDDYSFNHDVSPDISIKDASEELNQRFREQGCGYQIEGGRIVRVDSQYIHQEAVRPALQLLSEERFAGANEEFLSAHQHYRNGRYKECLNECLKALESTLKVICKARKWPYAESDSASRLLATVFQQGLIPPFLQSEFSSLRASLESGIPPARNRLSGHGQGDTVVQVPEHLAAYLLHLTAASIVFLITSDRH